MPQKQVLRYLKDQKVFTDYAFQAFSSRFQDRQEFDAFFVSIGSDAEKDAFLRVGTFYLFLVKNGDWTVNVQGSNPVIDYFTNSYKLVSLFSLIESLSDDKHIDFYAWLIAKSTRASFPLSRKKLDVQYKAYKTKHGSIKRCVAFFEKLPTAQQEKLTAAFSQDDKKLKVNDVASFLYELRSKFVHEGRLVLQISTMPHLVFRNKKATLLLLSMSDFLEVFEHGIVAYFTPPAPLRTRRQGTGAFRHP